MKVLVTGGTGFIGKALVKHLNSKGYEVTLIARNLVRAKTFFPDLSVIEWADFNSSIKFPEKSYDALINLMGENIAAKRWSEERKTALSHSRVFGTESLIKNLISEKVNIGTFIQASAVGYYGGDIENQVTEESDPGSDFLANLCVEWESALDKNKDQFERVVFIRTGMVIGKNGGAMAKILPPFKLGLGGKLSNGDQMMSWIHIDDLVYVYDQCIHHEDFSGPFNATTPFPVSNSEFTKILGKVLKRPTALPVPKFALQLLLGDMSQLLIGNCDVYPQKLKGSKFFYRYPTMEKALKEVVSK